MERMTDMHALVDLETSLAVQAWDDLDCTVWFKDTQAGKPATVFILGSGMAYTVRLVRPVSRGQ